MHIKKFEAETFEQALAQVKSTLGPNALILSSEEKAGGWFQKGTVEITAAYEPQPEKEWDETDLERVFPHRKKGREAAPTLIPGTYADAGSEEFSSIKSRQVARAREAASTMEEMFLEMGLGAASSQDFARQVTFNFPKRDREDPTFLEKIKCKLLAEGIKTLGSDVFQSRRSWAAVGTPGCGKTSLLVKLALTLRGQGYSVGLASADNRKVIGRQELAAYSKLSGLAFVLGQERESERITLLDTPSISHADEALFKQVEKSTRDLNTVLVLDSSQRLTELLRTVDSMSRLAPVALAFTRLDLVSQAGVIHDVLKATKLPLLGLSVSAGFNSSFRFFEPASLARYITRLKENLCQK